jgi:hypothetical protein
MHILAFYYGVYRIDTTAAEGKVPFMKEELLAGAIVAASTLSFQAGVLYVRSRTKAVRRYTSIRIDLSSTAVT